MSKVLTFASAAWLADPKHTVSEVICLVWALLYGLTHNSAVLGSVLLLLAAAPLLLLPTPCWCCRRGDKSFFLVAAVGGAAVLGALYFFLNSQTQL